MDQSNRFFFQENDGRNHCIGDGLRKGIKVFTNYLYFIYSIIYKIVLVYEFFPILLIFELQKIRSIKVYWQTWVAQHLVLKFLIKVIGKLKTRKEALFDLWLGCSVPGVASRNDRFHHSIDLASLVQTTRQCFNQL